MFLNQESNSELSDSTWNGPEQANLIFQKIKWPPWDLGCSNKALLQEGWGIGNVLITKLESSIDLKLYRNNRLCL